MDLVNIFEITKQNHTQSLNEVVNTNSSDKKSLDSTIHQLQSKCSHLETENRKLKEVVNSLNNKIRSCETEIKSLQKSTMQLPPKPSTSTSQDRAPTRGNAKDSSSLIAKPSTSTGTREDAAVTYNVTTHNKFATLQQASNQKTNSRTNNTNVRTTNNNKRPMKNNQTEETYQTKKVAIICDETGFDIDVRKMYTGKYKASLFKLRPNQNINDARQIVQDIRMRPDYVVFCIGTHDVIRYHQRDVEHEFNQLISETARKWPTTKIICVPVVARRCASTIPLHEAHRRTGLFSDILYANNHIHIVSTDLINSPENFNGNRLSNKGVAALIRSIKKTVANNNTHYV